MYNITAHIGGVVFMNEEVTQETIEEPVKEDKKEVEKDLSVDVALRLQQLTNLNISIIARTEALVLVSNILKAFLDVRQQDPRMKLSDAEVEAMQNVLSSFEKDINNWRLDLIKNTGLSELLQPEKVEEPEETKKVENVVESEKVSEKVEVSEAEKTKEEK